MSCFGPWHSEQVATIWTKKAINSVNADNTVYNKKRQSQYDTSSDEYNLWRVGRQIKLPAMTKAIVLVCSQGTGGMTIETHRKIVGRRCAMSGLGLMDIFSRKLFYFYVANMTAKVANFSKFMIVAYASRAPACIVHNRDDKMSMFVDAGPFLTQCDRRSTVPTLMRFATSCRRATTSELITTPHWKFWTKIRRPIREKSSWYPINVRCFTTNQGECLNNSKACVIATLGQLNRYSTRSSSPTRTTDPLTLLSIEPAQRKESS